MPTLPLEGREHKVFVIVPFIKQNTCQLSLQKDENTRSLLLCLLENHTHANSPSRRKRTQGLCYCAFQKTIHMPTLPLEGENTRSLLLCLLENHTHANSPSRRKRTQGLCYCAFQKTIHMPTLPLEGREHKVFVIVPFRKPDTCQLSLQKEENTRSLLLCLLENHTHANSPSRRKRTQGLCYCAFQKTTHRPTLPL